MGHVMFVTEMEALVPAVMAYLTVVSSMGHAMFVTEMEALVPAVMAYLVVVSSMMHAMFVTEMEALVPAVMAYLTVVSSMMHAMFVTVMAHHVQRLRREEGVLLPSTLPMVTLKVVAYPFQLLPVPVAVLWYLGLVLTCGRPGPRKKSKKLTKSQEA